MINLPFPILSPFAVKQVRVFERKEQISIPIVSSGRTSVGTEDFANIDKLFNTMGRLKSVIKRPKYDNKLVVVDDPFQPPSPSTGAGGVFTLDQVYQSSNPQFKNASFEVVLLDEPPLDRTNFVVKSYGLRLNMKCGMYHRALYNISSQMIHFPNYRMTNREPFGSISNSVSLMIYQFGYAGVQSLSDSCDRRHPIDEPRLNFTCTDPRAVAGGIFVYGGVQAYVYTPEVRSDWYGPFRAVTDDDVNSDVGHSLYRSNFVFKPIFCEHTKSLVRGIVEDVNGGRTYKDLETVQISTHRQK
jgi:hypothetical protein